MAEMATIRRLGVEMATIRRPRLGRMRIWSEDEVRAAMPPPVEVVDLMADGLGLLADGRCDVRPKQGVSVRPGTFSDAMPAAIPERRLLRLKWVSIFSDNPAMGLPTASGVVVLNDADTGVPTHLLPAGPITAVRTAAVTAACVRALAPGEPVSYLGAGQQAESHVCMLAAVGVPEVTIWARRPEQIEQLRDRLGDSPGTRVITVADREEAVLSASTLITGLSIGLCDTQIAPDQVSDDALLLPIDYASCIGPDLARTGVLAADDVDQFTSIRDGGRKLDDYPDPTAWTGDLIRNPRPSGRVIVQNLGSAVNDLLLADRIVKWSR